MGYRNRRKWSAVVAGLLLAQAWLPGVGLAAAPDEAGGGHERPVLATLPQNGAQTVRPDTSIEVQLDQGSRFYDAWDKRYRAGVTLTLLNDGGQAVFTTGDEELQYDPLTGTLHFTPPQTLDRYTTYGVVVTPDKLPKSLLGDSGRKDMPVQPDKVVTPLSDAALLASEEAANEAPAASALAAPASNPDLLDLQQRTHDIADKPHKQQPPQRVGPQAVLAVDGALHAIDVKEGKNQKGIVERVEGTTVTLFGGRQFTLTQDTHVHRPDQPGGDTLADLTPGDFVIVTVDAHSQVTNVNVTNRQDALSFVFTTGSALHEPTQVRVEQAEQAPRVTEDGHFTLVSTDDYGLPAWGSTTDVALETVDGSPLDASAQVLPSASFVTANENGRTAVTVVDHLVQTVAAKVSMDGPYADGKDAHGFVVVFNFRPGLPANATLTGPETMVVGTGAELTGVVTDVYGNVVEDGSELTFTATAGEVSTPAYTVNGEFRTAYKAATRVQDVTVHLASTEGTAAADTVITLLPDLPDHMTLQAPAQVPAGESVTIRGQVFDRYDNAVLDGSDLLLSATAGELPNAVTTTNGAYEATYTAPTKVQTVQLAATSVEGTASREATVEIVAGPVANLSLQAQDTDLYVQESTQLSGQTSDRYGNLVTGQVVTLQAEKGSLSDPAPQTDAAGLYASIYTAPAVNGSDTVTATADEVSAAVTLNIHLQDGTGYNPATGQVEAVARIAFDVSNYQAAASEIINLSGHVYNANGQPLQGVEFSDAQATAGTIKSLSYQTDANGAFVLTYQAPDSKQAATVTITSGEINAQAQINSQAIGVGFNPKTGQWEPVGSITIDVDTVRYSFVQEYDLSLLPGATVDITGHVYGESGDPLTQVQFDTLTATDGTISLASEPDQTGAFTLQYNTPETEGNQMLQIGSGSALTTVNTTITTFGYGVNTVTRQMEPVAQIVFDPTSYTVGAGGSITLTGRTLNADGVPLAMAKVNVSVDGGFTSNQAISGIDGTFSLFYIAPMQPGTYHAQASTAPDVFGTAVIDVIQPEPPHFETPYLSMSGFGYAQYWIGTINWGAQVMQSNGLPAADQLFTLDKGFYQFLDLQFTDAYGTLQGGPIQFNTPYQWYTISSTGITYYATITLTMSGFDMQSLSYVEPSYAQTFTVHWTNSR
ncbi:MAG TPA: Ig-like domain-containing protein [Bacilli bacterium]|nr:Ig-like domain-containing protein [Bacilli bacterium]